MWMSRLTFVGTSASLRGEVKVQLHEQLRDPVREQLHEQLQDPVRVQLHEQLQDPVRVQLHEQLQDPVRVQLHEQLHRRARAFVQAFEQGLAMPEPFDSLAVDLARFQAEHVSGFARLMGARGIDPAELKTAGEVPAVPTDAFKLTRVATFPESEQTQTFRTSGTTQGQETRGVHPFRDVGTYHLGSRWPSVAPAWWPTCWRARPRLPVLVLGPSPEELPDSSLTPHERPLRR